MGDSPVALAPRDALRSLAEADQAGGHDRVGRQRPARRVDGHVVAQPEGLGDDQLLVGERCVQLGEVDLAVAHSGLLACQLRGRRDREVAHAEGVGLDAVVEAADPRRPVAELAGEVARGQDQRGGAVGDGRAVVLAQRVGQVRLGEDLVDREVPGQLGLGVGLRVGPVADRDLGQVGLGGLARVEQGPGLEAGDADRVGPQRRDRVGLELGGQHLGQVARRGLPVAVDERRVDLADLELHPGLVERPGTVHLHVALDDGRPRSDGVEDRDEREGLAGEEVGAAGAGEPDGVGAEAGALPELTHHRHHHLDLVEALDPALVLALREGDDRDVPHHTGTSFVGAPSASGS